MLELFAECVAIAAASGYAPRPEFVAATRAALTQRGSALAASMLRDVERGGGAEGDHILGDLLLRAREKAVAAPLLRVARAHLQVYEARAGARVGQADRLCERPGVRRPPCAHALIEPRFVISPARKRRAS